MEIVFVHFGSRVPKYLMQNIKRTCDFFPETTVTLITDLSSKVSIKKSNFQKFNFEMNDDYVNLDQSLSHPKNFRNNFWFTSLARILVLCDYVIAKNVQILHIESDVLISSDFPLNQFKACDRPVAYPVIGKQSAVASTLWIGNPEAAHRLRSYSTTLVQNDPTMTDMKILGRFQQDFPKFVRVLASFPTGSEGAYSPPSPEILKDMRYTENLFNGYFDAADVGSYLLGDDPRNHRGVKFLRRQLDTSYFRPRNIQYVYASNRKFLNTSSGLIDQFYSLHIHSKNSQVFNERRISNVLAKAIKNQGKVERHTLIILVLISSIRHSIKRRLKVLIARRK